MYDDNDVLLQLLRWSFWEINYFNKMNKTLSWDALCPSTRIKSVRSGTIWLWWYSILLLQPFHNEGYKLLLNFILLHEKNTTYHEVSRQQIFIRFHQITAVNCTYINDYQTFFFYIIKETKKLREKKDHLPFWTWSFCDPWTQWAELEAWDHCSQEKTHDNAGTTPVMTYLQQTVDWYHCKP